MSAAKRVGVLTAGGDSPGLNAALRGLGKAALGRHGMAIGHLLGPAARLADICRFWLCEIAKTSTGRTKLA